MYEDTIKVANKIISDHDLEDIFYKINEEIEHYKKLSEEEKRLNTNLDRKNQKWTLKDYQSSFKVNVNFYDDTEVTFDNFTNFISTFNNRINEIKSFFLVCYVSYFSNVNELKYISQSIKLDVYESKMNINVNLNSNDEVMNKVYEFIKEKILNAPERYDEVIKKKISITNKIYFGFGAIPSLIILSFLIVIPTVRNIYIMTYILYPLICLILAYSIGTVILSGKLERLYKNILPNRKYAGYDKKTSKSIYESDIKTFLNEGEIIIGNNVDNIINRNEIKNLENKYSKFIPYELMLIIVISLIIICLNFI